MRPNQRGPHAPRPLPKLIGSLTPFSRLPGFEVERLSDASRYVESCKGENLFTEGQRAAGVWFIVSGRVEIFKYTTTGRVIAIESLGPGQWIGTLCRVGCDRASYPCTAVAAVDSSFVCMQEAAFWPLLDRVPELMAAFGKMCSRRLCELRELPAIAMESSDKRVIKTLLHLADEHGLELPFSKREISELAGTAPETTIRVMGSFERRAWVVVEDGKLILKEPAKLRDYLSAH